MSVDKIGDFEFKNIKELGKGSYGKVFLIEKDGKKKALKVIENPGREGIKSLRELDIMSRLIHPYLTNSEKIVTEFIPNPSFNPSFNTSFNPSFNTSFNPSSENGKEKKEEKEKGEKMGKDISRIGIVMEVAERDLHTAMYDKKFTSKERINSLYQITQGLKFLHESNYLHLDIKPSNILLFEKERTKLTDFGLSLLLAGKFKYYPNPLVTINYRSPAILEGKKDYNTADDVWSLGLVFLDVLSNGKSLFSNFKEEDFVPYKVLELIKYKFSNKNINSTLNTFLVYEKEKAIPLLKSMLSLEEGKRASLSEVLSSPLFFHLKNGVEGIRKDLSIGKVNCDFLCYEGFDVLVRLCTKVSISLETFFLAVDIYQRALAFRNSKKDEKNIIYTATLSLYIAIKMIESYFADAEKLASLNENIFSGEDIMKGEVVLANNLGGIFYNKNFFTQSTTHRRLNEGFELSRNCFLYGSIDFQKWKILSQEEEKIEGSFSKYIPFIDFFLSTPYYRLILDEKNDVKYLEKLYEEDSKKF